MLRTISMVDASQFTSPHCSELLEVLIHHQSLVKDDKLTVYTNIHFNHPSEIMQAFNHYLRMLQTQNVVSIIIDLQK